MSITLEARAITNGFRIGDRVTPIPLTHPMRGLHGRVIAIMESWVIRGEKVVGAIEIEFPEGERIVAPAAAWQPH